MNSDEESQTKRSRKKRKNNDMNQNQIQKKEKKTESVFPTDGTLFDLEKSLKRTKEKHKAKGRS